MGASYWSYFVPYDSNINHALEQLRNAVFQRGDYLLLGDWELFNERDDRIAAGEDPAVVEVDWKAKRANQPHPSSIDELFDWNNEAGTHSIIDMTDGVSATQAFGTVSPLTDDQLLTAFGTLKPNRDHIEQWEADDDSILKLRSRWQGLYIIVYENNAATMLFFAGFSGD